MMRPVGRAGPELAAGTGALSGARASVVASVCQASSVQRVAEQILLVAVDGQTPYAAHKIHGRHLKDIVLQLQQIVFHALCLYSSLFH